MNLLNIISNISTSTNNNTHKTALSRNQVKFVFYQR